MTSQGWNHWREQVPEFTWKIKPSSICLGWECFWGQAEVKGKAGKSDWELMLNSWTLIIYYCRWVLWLCIRPHSKYFRSLSSVKQGLALLWRELGELVEIKHVAYSKACNTLCESWLFVLWTYLNASRKGKQKFNDKLKSKSWGGAGPCL